MISVALTLGAMPPVIASGASSETKNANLTWGGIVSETMLVVLFLLLERPSSRRWSPSAVFSLNYAL